MSMFTEGYETSSSVLAFAIYELARNPDIQERLYQEIDDVLAKYDGECPFEALQEMEYLDMVIHETMRLDVVAPLISRICTKEYTMPLIDGQKEPVKLQPGTAVQINCRSIHMLVWKHLVFFFMEVKIYNLNYSCNFISKQGSRALPRSRGIRPESIYPRRTSKSTQSCLSTIWRRTKK